MSKIEQIKKYRAGTGCGLREAKLVIDLKEADFHVDERITESLNVIDRAKSEMDQAIHEFERALHTARGRLLIELQNNQGMNLRQAVAVANFLLTQNRPRYHTFLYKEMNK